jgi:hypothetical protein
MVRNDYARFGEHVDIEVSNKILRLEILKVPSLGKLPYIQIVLLHIHILYTDSIFIQGF